MNKNFLLFASAYGLAAFATGVAWHLGIAWLVLIAITAAVTGVFFSIRHGFQAEELPG
jgi:hypothetical protein